MEHIHPPERALRDGRSKVKEQPAGHSQAIHHEQEDEVAHLLTAVVATLRRNFFRSEGDLEEATRVATEIAEPLDRIHVPGQQRIEHSSKAMRSKDEEPDQVKGVDNSDTDVPNHQIVGRFVS